MNAILKQRLTDATRAILGSLIRRVLTIIGTALVTRGLVDQGSVDGIIPMAVELIAGAILTSAATGWGVLRAYLTHTRLARAWAAAVKAAKQPETAPPSA